MVSCHENIFFGTFAVCGKRRPNRPLRFRRIQYTYVAETAIIIYYK